MPRPKPMTPGPGQESVWDYPRPPRLEEVGDHLRVIFDGESIADSVAGFRVLETSHPPVYYIPPEDIAQRYLAKAPGSTWCEFKGRATYWSLDVNGRRAENAAWSYPQPSPAFPSIAGYFAFYASRVDECWVGGKVVLPQEGDFLRRLDHRACGRAVQGRPGTSGW
jgi:uncharacterized protein (DUF427 family)